MNNNELILKIKECTPYCNWSTDSVDKLDKILTEYIGNSVEVSLARMARSLDTLVTIAENEANKVNERIR